MQVLPLGSGRLPAIEPMLPRHQPAVVCGL